jgi:hypothetical protein
MMGLVANTISSHEVDGNNRNVNDIPSVWFVQTSFTFSSLHMKDCL